MNIGAHFDYNHQIAVNIGTHFDYNHQIAGEYRHTTTSLVNHLFCANGREFGDCNIVVTFRQCLSAIVSKLIQTVSFYALC